jgi:BirA family transcriptional regulator, biotin operon repressor / biotin---[acetyl-CoA-carboxylase] ligase
MGRMEQEFSALDESIISAYLNAEESGGCPRFFFFPEVDSTNSEAERKLKSGMKTPFLILAAKQTLGRGRLGRKWYSPQEGNCYMSFVFEPEVGAVCMQLFTVWMSLNFCRLLDEKFNFPVMVKWPNDLVLEDKKIGGMLAECRVDRGQIRYVIFGVGLNVNSCCKRWPDEFSAVATSLAEVKGNRILPVNSLVADFILNGFNAYRAFCKGGIQEELMILWDRFDAIDGKLITVSLGKRLLRGVAEGINEQGALLLRVENDNKVIALSGGEISLRGNTL